MLHGAGEVDRAYAIYRQMLEVDPANARLQELAGIASLQSGRAADAVREFKAAALLEPSKISIYRNLATSLQKIGDVLAALEADRNADKLAALEALRGRPASSSPPTQAVVDALPARAELALANGDPAAAVAHWLSYLEVNPQSAAAWSNLAMAHRAAEDRDAAASALRHALEIDDRFVPAWNNLTVCLLEAEHLHEALSTVERTLELAPRLANAHSNRGMILRLMRDTTGARESFERALALDPQLFEAQLNLGNLYYDGGDDRAAQACFERADKLKPSDADVAYSLGVTQPDPDLALRSLNRALQRRPIHPEAEVARVFTQLKGCDWTDLDVRLARVEQMAHDPAVRAPSPFWMLALSESRQTQLTVARKWAGERLRPAVAPTLTRSSVGTRDKVRVGFLSGDLRDHAVGQLLVDLLPRLAGGACQLYGYDVSPEDDSAVRASLRGAFHHLREAAHLSLPGLAQCMADDALDVLVDLSGYSQHSRSGVLAWRPAGSQVSYLGFPGTMGWDAVDVLLADDFLVPALHAPDYSERIVRLPHCYQPARRFDLPATPSRTAVGLPENGLVLASFGNGYKLRPAVFETWLRVLKARPGSVLWLARYNDAMVRNLGAAARAQGVEPERLVFAPLLPIADHMARLPLADLCLDTTPYGSGVTATQALFAGVPLLTVAGSTYVGRMAASVLHGLGLPQLVTANLAEYESQALHLSDDKALLKRLRDRLIDARVASPIFDIERSARDVELALLRLADVGRHSIQRTKEDTP